MALELAEQSVAADGSLRVAFVPSGNALSVAVLDGDETKALTYSFTPSGFNRTTTENTIEDPRLTLRQSFTRPGTTSEALEVQYVFGGDDEVARIALAEGTTGTLVVRYAVANEDEWAAGDVVDLIPIQAGRQRKDPPTANSVWTITQGMYVTGTVQEDVVLVA